ncbi:hypothetical protein [Kitasatospora aureofaciens]|uniref:hypothetical protein n=1 Tax=Kitasatospora aureofaciens TaxID=1894 RepID=UPI0033F31FCE
MGFDQARVNRIFRPETYAEDVPYGLFRGLRAEAPDRWVEEPARGVGPEYPDPGSTGLQRAVRVLAQGLLSGVS